MVNPLDNGNPLTYNWLNQLANTVISHDKSLNKVSGSQKINVVPGHISTGIGSGTVQILTGQASVTFRPNSQNDFVDVIFKNAFANDQVIVLAQVNFNNSGPSGFISVVNPTRIKLNGCRLNVHRFPPFKKTQTATAVVSYIAIGPGKAL
jgi:hypothetical protein